MLSHNTQTKLGKIGAARQSWNRHSPRDILKRTLEANPRKTEEQIFDLFTAEVFGENPRTPVLLAIVEYWFTNNYRSLLRAEITPAVIEQRKEERAVKVAEIKQVVNRHIEREAIKMLGLLMPNGKKLADCTRRDLKELSARVGPWADAMAAKLKGSQTVGAVFTEAEVSDLYARAK